LEQVGEVDPGFNSPSYPHVKYSIGTSIMPEVFDEIEIGTSVTLRGLTLKGKNRIKEHGNEWTVISEMGGNILFRSNKDGYLKWLSPDLEIVEEV
jgi:hypothetical protein